MDIALRIGGRFENGTGATERILNPRNGEVIAEVPEASPSQVNDAVAAAAHAFEGWSRTTPAERSLLLLKIADSIERDAEEYAALESLNCGKPRHLVLADKIPGIVDCFRFFAARAESFSDNIVCNIAVASGFGRIGALLASFAVILSSIATLEITMLQFSRALFAMGRDGALPRSFGEVDARTRAPVRAMILLIVVGLLLIWASSLMPTINMIIADSVRAVAALVAYYYGLARLVAAYVFAGLWRQSPWRWVTLSVFPALSRVTLIVLGIYALTTFDRTTNIVGVGGLLAGIVFFRPRRFVIGAISGTE